MEEKLLQLERLLAQMLVRVSAVESLLIDKEIVKEQELSDAVTKNVKTLTTIMESLRDKTQN